MKKIIVLPGDGIGPEITKEALKVIKAAVKNSSETIEIEEYEFGGASIDKYGVPFTDELKGKLDNADAVLLGAVGGPKWDNVDPSIRPEKGLLQIRSYMGLFCNLRPIKVYESLMDNSPVKIKKPLDFMIVRELTGGIYFGDKRTYEKDGITHATDEMTYNKYEIERISKWAINIAKDGGKKVTVVDKANVLDSSKLWRKTIAEMDEAKGVTVEHMYVDNAAMQLILAPEQFEVVLTSNMFGDILSDAGGAITGSIGLLPSASLSEGKKGLYEPIHGSAPDIAGKNIANPIGTILSAAMLLRHSLDMPNEADMIEKAVEKAIDNKILSGEMLKDCKGYSTSEIGDYIVNQILGIKFR